jgi:hypothetical protein
MNNTRLKPSDINDVDILINGRKLGQRQVDGTFFVGNLIPGVYSVDIDAEKLPLELNVARKSLKAEVRNGAVTEVNFPVYAEYGMAGRVTDHSGSGQADALITVRDIEGKTAATTFTNAFGYYRIDGLRPGNYTVDAAESETGSGKTAPREVSIKDDYLFEINFSISADRRPAVPRSGNSSETMPDEKRSSEKHPDKPEDSFLPDHAAIPDTSAVNRAVQFGVFRNHKNASALVEKLKAIYPESSLTILNDHGSFKVRLLRSLLSLQEIMRSAEGLSLKPLIIREEEKNQGTAAS